MSPETRWSTGLGLTILIIGILACVVYGIGIIRNHDFPSIKSDLDSIRLQLSNLESKPVDTSGITHSEMQDLRFKVNSIERFIRTTPLVECGNCDKKP